MLFRRRVRFRSAACASANSAEMPAERAVAGVDLDLLAGLGVLERDDPDIRQHFLALVLHMERDEIVPPAGDRELAREVARLEVGDEKHDRATRLHFVQVSQRQRRIGPAALRFEEENFADQTERVRAAFLRRDVELHLVGEEEQPDLVVIPDGAEGEQAGHFRREFALRLRDAAKTAGGAHVDHEHDCELALFGELFHKGHAEARGHIPIDRANLVARLILADFVEIHPAPLEDAVIIPRKNRLHQPAGLDLERADFGEDFGGRLLACGVAVFHHGTGKPAKIRSMIVSLEIVSASAS